MEWSRGLSLDLINKFREREILWNPKHPTYNSKAKRENAWTEIAAELGKPVNEVKKKMECLKGSFRGVKARLRKARIRRKGKNEVCGSKWFAFEALKFLNESDDPRTIHDDLDYSDSKEVLFWEKEESLHVLEEQGTSSSLCAEASGSGTQDTKLPVPEISVTSEPPEEKIQNLRRHTTDEDPIIAEALTYLRETVTAVKKPKDRCAIFGELVAEKLRSFDNKRQAIAEQKINTILFEMEMSSYGYGHII